MPESDNRPYRPSPRDRRYLEALREVLREPGSAPRTRLAALTGIARNRLSTFERHARRMEWVRAELIAGREDAWERLVTYAFNRAMKGDIKWAHFAAQAIGKFGPYSGSSAGGFEAQGPRTIISYIPRPEYAPLPAAHAPQAKVKAELPVAGDILDLAGDRTRSWQSRSGGMTPASPVPVDVLDLLDRPRAKRGPDR
jgi:hypothetical protein